MIRNIFTYALSGLLAATASAAVVEERQFGRLKTPIDAALYANIAKYPAYSTAPYIAPNILPKPCIPPYGSVQTDYINITSTGTQMAIFRNDKDKDIVVGIPGSNETLDYFADFNVEQVPYFSPNVSCAGCMTHAGFLVSWNSISASVQQALQRQLAKYPSYGVVIAGHSLGGGLCALAYATLTGAKFPIKGAYCSGAPRVGNQLFANYIDKLSGASDTKIGNYYRMTHYNDGVPQILSLQQGYRHPRTEIFEAAYNATLGTTYRCYGQEAVDCNFSYGQNQLINNAHGTYAGVRYDCMGGFTPAPPNP